jgi:hypothetical protein
MSAADEAELRETIRDWTELATFEQVLEAVKAHDREKQAEALEQAARRTGDLVLKHDLVRMAAEYRNTGNTETE